MIAGAASATTAKTASAVGIILLLVAALGVVVQLKDALNTIWDVDQGGKTGTWAFTRSYVVSLAGILGLGFLLAVSLILSTALAAITASFGMTASEGIFWHGVDLVISLVVLSLLFGMLFKFFPDAAIQWQDVWSGAFVTAVLFEVGKMAIAWYVGMESLQSTYGAASSLVVLLIWVYYASQIVLFGESLRTFMPSRDAPGRNERQVASTCVPASRAYIAEEDGWGVQPRQGIAVPASFPHCQGSGHRIDAAMVSCDTSSRLSAQPFA
jgi:membrane protein